jgi:putative spermidine/putrescine transport system ATP-binding protein
MSTNETGRLELRGIGKRYGDVHAVRDVSVTIPPGEFLTLLGASGSGKTTTLKAIAGFVEPDAGEVLLDDEAITKLPPHKRNIGMVFQNYALFPHMSVTENVAFPLRVRGVPRAQRAERVRAALAAVRLERLGDRRPGQLSGGQQQRVALARTIVFEPRLLLMDEPMGALDKKLREALQLEIMRIHRELGVTIVYVTHDQEEALVMSDRIAIYHEGRVRQIGSADALYERPESVYVADFMGESNIFRGTFAAGAGAARVAAAERTFLAPTGRGAAPLVEGAPAAIVVRPERMRVGRGPAVAADGSNALEGAVRDVIYLGSGRKYLIDLADGGVLQVRVAAPDDAGDLERGAVVHVAWHCEDSVLLPDEDAADVEADEPVGVAA